MVDLCVTWDDERGVRPRPGWLSLAASERSRAADACLHGKGTARSFTSERLARGGSLSNKRIRDAPTCGLTEPPSINQGGELATYSPCSGLTQFLSKRHLTRLHRLPNDHRRMHFNLKQSYTPALELSELNERALIIDTETLGSGPTIEIIEIAVGDVAGQIQLSPASFQSAPSTVKACSLQPHGIRRSTVLGRHLAKTQDVDREQVANCLQR